MVMSRRWRHSRKAKSWSSVKISAQRPVMSGGLKSPDAVHMSAGRRSADRSLLIDVCWWIAGLPMCAFLLDRLVVRRSKSYLMMRISSEAEQLYTTGSTRRAGGAEL